MTPTLRPLEDAARPRQMPRAIGVGLLAALWLLAPRRRPRTPRCCHTKPKTRWRNGSPSSSLFFVPVLLIVLFWLVHILPEQIAHKRHHPQFEAIRTLCLLSLVFGGLLWPLAWIWAYTKPVGYKLAYGTDKHPDYFKEHGIPEPDDPAADIRRRMAALEERGVPASELDAIRADLVLIESRLESGETPGGVK